MNKIRKVTQENWVQTPYGRKIKIASDTGKIPFKLSDKLIVMALPGSDINELRKKYSIV